MRLAQPIWLLLLPLFVLPWLHQLSRGRLGWPSLDAFTQARNASSRARALLPPTLFSLAILFAIIALARPQTVAGRQRIKGQGVAIVVLLDRSRSMLQPFDSSRTTRLNAAKSAFEHFVQNRPDDLIGLVAFANYPDLTCPPTLDHLFLNDVARSLQPASDPGEDGTSIGNALVWGLSAVDKIDNQQKILILITDGENNPQGILPAPIDPLEAAKLAGELGVTLHTIGVGRPGDRQVTDPISGLRIPSDVEGPDFALLSQLATLAKGSAFMAWDQPRLEAVYQTIDGLTKSPIEDTILTRYREWFPTWLIAAVTVMATACLSAATGSRTTP